MTANINGGNTQLQPSGDPFSQMVRLACEEAIKSVLKAGSLSSRRLLSIEETATYLNLCPRAIRNMIACKELVGVRSGRRQMLDLRDLDAWIEARKAT